MILNLIDYDKSPDEDDDDDDCFNLEGIEGKQKPKVVLSPLSKLRFGELSMTVVDKHKGFINERNLGCENGFSSSDSSESNSSILLQSFFQMSFFSSAIPDIAETTTKSPTGQHTQYGLIVNSNTESKISVDSELFGTEQSFEFADVYGKRRDKTSLSTMVDFDREIISEDDPEPPPCKDCGARPVWIVSYDRWSITDRRCDACSLNSDEQEPLSSARQVQSFTHGHSLHYIDGEEIIFDRAEYKGNIWDKQGAHSWFVAQTNKNGATDDEQNADSSALCEIEEDNDDNALNSEIVSIEITDIYKCNDEDVPAPSFTSSRTIFNRAAGLRSRLEHLGDSSPSADGPVVGLGSSKTSPKEFQRPNDVDYYFTINESINHQLLGDIEDCQETFPLISSQDGRPCRSPHRVPLEIATPTNRFNVEHGEAFIDEDSAEDYYSQPFFCYLLCGLFS